MFRLDLPGRCLDARRATQNRGETVYSRVEYVRAAALGISAQGAGQGGRVHRAVLRRKHGAETGCGGGESLRDLRGLEPIAAQSRLTLVGDGFAQSLGF